MSLDISCELILMNFIKMKSEKSKKFFEIDPNKVKIIQDK